MYEFPTEKLLLQFRVQRAENGDLEIGDHPVDKVVYGKKSSTRLQYPCL